MDKQLSSLKAHVRDLETSLQINKDMLDNLFSTPGVKPSKSLKKL